MPPTCTSWTATPIPSIRRKAAWAAGTPGGWPTRRCCRTGHPTRRGSATGAWDSTWSLSSAARRSVIWRGTTRRSSSRFAAPNLASLAIFSTTWRSPGALGQARAVRAPGLQDRARQGVAHAIESPVGFVGVAFGLVCRPQPGRRPCRAGSRPVRRRHGRGVHARRASRRRPALRGVHTRRDSARAPSAT